MTIMKLKPSAAENFSQQVAARKKNLKSKMFKNNNFIQK